MEAPLALKRVETGEKQLQDLAAGPGGSMPMLAGLVPCRAAEPPGITGTWGQDHRDTSDGSSAGPPWAGQGSAQPAVAAERGKSGTRMGLSAPWKNSSEKADAAVPQEG